MENNLENVNIISSISDLLTKIMGKRNLSHPDERPLFHYRIKDHEYKVLEALLSKYDIDTINWSAGFVFYATEWWRRNFSGSHWTWDPILQTIGKSNINTAKRSQIVEKGFHYWKRKIHTDQFTQRRDFLGSIFAESGIPNNVLTNEINWLPNLIVGSYKEFSGTSLSETDSILPIRLNVQRRPIPEVLNNDSFFGLIKDVVVSLIYIKRKYQLDDKPEPVNYLDNEFPDWRDNFPVKIDEVGKTFLDNILSEVAKIRETYKYEIKIDHKLIKINDQYSIKAQLVIPGKFYNFEELGLSQSEFDKFSSKAQIFLTSDNQDRIQLGYAFKPKNRDGFQINRVSANLPMINAFQKEWELSMVDSLSGESAILELPGGDALDVDMPWVFLKDNNDWMLKTQGSVRSSKDEAKIICKKNAQIECEEFVELSSFSEDQKIIKINSICFISDTENKFKIRLSSDSDDNFQYRLVSSKNKIIPYFTKENSKVFIGFPSIVQTETETGHKNIIGANRGNIQIKKPTGSNWQNANALFHGNFKMRLLGNEDEVLHTQKIMVLPDSFSVQLKNQNQGMGIINLTGTGEYELSVIYKKVKGEITQTEEGHKIELSAKNELFAESITMKLQSAEHGTIKLKVPFPNDEPKIVNNEEEVVAQHSTLYINNLHGYRLLCTNTRDTSRTLKIRLELIDSYADYLQNIIKSKPLKIQGESNLEKSLIDFKDDLEQLFAASSASIDAYIKLWFDNNQYIKIKQYQYTGNFNKDDHSFCINTNEAINGDNISVKAFRLDMPLQDENILTLDFDPEKYIWIFPNEYKSTGKWMIFPGQGSKIMFRPNVIVFKTNDVPSKIETVDQIWEASLTDYENRIELFSQLFERISMDFENPNWNELQILWKNTSHLPLGVFDIWKAIVKTPKALISCFINLESKLIEKLNNEFLINWNLILVDDWIKLFNAYKEYLDNITSSTDLTKKLINSKLQKLSSHLGLSFIADELLPSLLFNNNDINEIPKPLFISIIQESINGLRNRHQGERWPDSMKDFIVETFNNLPNSYKNLLPNDLSPYSKSVIYLPVLFALQSLNQELVELSEFDLLDSHRMNQVVEFDTEYFNDIYNFIQGYCYINLNNLNNE